MIHKNNYKAYLKEHLEFIEKYPKEVWSKIFELEEEFREYFWVQYASACSSGSTWLILALKALWIKRNDEIMLNCNYFISDPNSIIIAWGKPIFIDLWTTIDSLSIKDIKRKITPRTKAIIIIHLYGYPIVNTKEILTLCKERNITVIEDCCQSIGAKIWDDFVGTLGDIGIFSFDTNKMVKWWEWWMTISNNQEYTQKINLYKNNYKKNGEFMELWYNYRYNDFSAIYAKYSLRNLPNTLLGKLEKTRKIENVYTWWSGTNPSYYNFIIEKPNINIPKTDFYWLDYSWFKNYQKYMSQYSILDDKNNLNLLDSK